MPDQGPLQSGSTEVRQLMNELLAIERHRWQEAAREERFRNLLLAELLVAESGRFEEACPEKAEELANLARMIADQPYPGLLVARVDRILARSYALQGNVRRLSGDRHGAEERFQKAASALTGPPNGVERAFYCQRLACLREEQGHVEEATALLWRAVGIFREARAMEAQGACLSRIAFLFLHGNELEPASRLFAQARGLLTFECSPALAARCSLGMALCLAALGQGEPARSLRMESRVLGEVVLDSRVLLELDWLEGRLALHLGEHQEAIATLCSVRRRLFVQRRLLDVALCSLDLARVFVATEQAARVQELIDEMQVVFPVSLDQVRMLVALHDFLESARSGKDMDGAALEAVDLIRRPMAILKKL
ncbi:MAG TPA: hypothetical protein VN493_22220 [Thermoanaerobaculia bacterium]|nr:hypothetical protein [Thermoanaerobaculia bacterium]